MNEIEENNQENKKQIRLTIIGIVAFLLLIFGATYAYFLIDTNNSTSKSNIKGDISKAGLVTLVPGTGNLHINLKVSDMALTNQGKEYYGDELEANPFVLSEEEGTHTISQVQITDGEETTKYSCTAKVVVTMEIAEDNNMGSVLEPGDLILQFKGNLISEQLDLSEIKESGTKEYNLKFKLKGNTTEDINAFIKLINRKENQNYLASKNLNVNINTTELSCDIAVPVSKITYLREKSNGKLTDNLIYGLYRYQSNSILDKDTYDKTDTVNNNYICLGSDCSSEESNDMYRIIGINENDEIKVIKNTPADDSIIWHNEQYSDTKWPDSDIFNYLNNDFYQTLSEELQKKIVKATWYYGDVADPRYCEENQNIFTPEEIAKCKELDYAINGYDGSELTDDQKRDKIKELTKMYSEALVKRENELTENVPANIGLMNLTDYCSSFESNGIYNCYTSYFYDSLDVVKNEDYGVTWLTSKADWGYDWTIEKEDFGDIGDGVWIVLAFGDFSDRVRSDYVAARPVFFLTSDIELSGEGTIENPFRVVGIE